MSDTLVECSENHDQANSSTLISVNNRHLVEKQNLAIDYNYNYTCQETKILKKNEISQLSIKPKGFSSDSDCDYSSGDENEATAPTANSLTPVISVEDEQHEIDVRNHFLKKFSKLKRLNADLDDNYSTVSQSTTNIDTNTNDEILESIKRARKKFHHDQFSDTSINLPQDIKNENDLNRANRDLIKTNSRSSCSSNTSGSSGIGSNVSSETNSFSSLNLFVKSCQYRNVIDAKIIENEDSQDQESNYEAENEDKLAARKNSKLVQSTKNVKKRKKFTKRSTSSSSRVVTASNIRDASLMSNLLFTMNEILTSQLILTRKVDKVNESFSSMNARLKYIEVICKKNKKTNQITGIRQSQPIPPLDSSKTAGNIQKEASKPQLNHSVNNKSSQKVESLDNSTKKDQSKLFSANVPSVTSHIHASLIGPSDTIGSSTSNSQEILKPDHSNSSTKSVNYDQHEFDNKNKNHMLSVSNLTENVNKLKPAQASTSFAQVKNQNQQHHNSHIMSSSFNKSVFPNKYYSHPDPGFHHQRRLSKNEYEDSNVLNFNSKLPFEYPHAKNKAEAANLIGDISNNAEISAKLGSLQSSAQNYSFLGHQGSKIFQQSQLHQQHQQNIHLQLSSRSSLPHMSHLISQPRFGSHSFLHQSISSPSNLIMTPQQAASNSSGLANFINNQNNIINNNNNSNKSISTCGNGKEGLRRTISTSSTTSRCQFEGQMQQQKHVNIVDDYKILLNNGSNSIENNEHEYDSGDENKDSNQQRAEQAANFIIQQHGLVRHAPSGSVDQLELDEESEMLVSREIIKRCARKAKHRGNFAANLAAELFNKEERVSCNCTGTRGKRQLSPRRLSLVKDITFRMYNVNPALLAAASSSNSSNSAVATAAVNAAYHDFEEAWRKECITAIDAKNRSIGRDLIKTSIGENRLPVNSGSREDMGSVAVDSNTMSPSAISVSYSNTDSNEAIDCV